MGIFIKKIIFKKNLWVPGILIIISLAFFVITPLIAQAQSGIDSAQSGLDTAADTGYGNNYITDVPSAIGKIIGAVLSFIGIIFFILLIYGGFTWMTARGNDEQVKKAIELITAACVGLAIIAAAYLLTRFIGETLLKSQTSSTQTQQANQDSGG